MIGALHRPSSYWNQETITQFALYALDLHGAKTPRNLLKNNHPAEAHGAAFYPAIELGCRCRASKIRDFRPVTAPRAQNHGAARQPNNQCADNKK
jgi:hypothetical protein